MEELQTWIELHFVPQILVLPSANARSSITKNNLTMIELFQPLSFLSTSISISTSKASWGVDHLKLSFVDNFEIRAVNDILQERAPSCIFSEPEVGTPWFADWQSNLYAKLRFSPHELIDMPLALIYIVSTSEEDIMQTLQFLDRPSSLPEQYQSNIYDLNACKIFLLVHDASDSELSHAEIASCFEKLQAAVQPHFCDWVVINSSKDPAMSPWGGNKGVFLSNENMSGLQSFVTEAAVSHIIPQTIETIKRLEAVLETRKKGLKKYFNNFFKKNNERIEMFKFTVRTTEHSLRLLADLYFLFREYSRAETCYKAIAADFKQAKAYAYAGAAYEMQAFCLSLLGSDFREIEQALEAAFHAYRHTANHFLLCRNILYMTTLFSVYKEYKKLIDKLLLSTTLITEVPYYYPLVLEQVAVCYLRMQKRRKYGFYLNLAANEYGHRKLLAYSLNCYYLSNTVYEGKGWDSISMHLLGVIARLLHVHKRSGEALQYYLKQLSCPRMLSAGLEYQKKALEDLVMASLTMYEMPGEMPFFPFPFPRINSCEVRLPQDTVVLANLKAPSKDVWADMCPPKYNSLKWLFESKRKTVTRKMNLGETIEVHLLLENPLQFPLYIENISVETEFAEELEATIKTIERLEIDSGSQIAVIIHVEPNHTGIIVIKGIQWTIGGSFYAIYKIEEERIKVENSSKSMILSILEYPNSMLYGQLSRITFALSNPLEEPIQDILLVVSKPAMFGKDQFEVGSLDAKEEKVFELWMRGGFIGTANIHFLFLYPPNKYCRAELAVPVRTSVVMIPRVEYSMKNPSNLLVQMTISPKKSWKITQISALSEHSLELIDKVTDDIIFMRIRQDTNNRDIYLAEGQIDTRSGVYWDIHQILKGNKTEGVDLMVAWEVQNNAEVIQGVNFIHGVDPFEKLKLPFHFVIQAPNQLSHDFQEELVVDVQVELKNITDGDVEMIIENHDCEFYWTGVNRQKVTLTPWERTSLKFIAHFSGPGVYNLNQFTIISSNNYISLPYQYWILIEEE